MRQTLRSRFGSVAAGLVLVATASTAAADAPPAPVVVLNTDSAWRCHLTLRPPVFGPAASARPRAEKVRLYRAGQRLDVDAPLDQPASALPPPEWTLPDFDDSDWFRGPFLLAATREIEFGFFEPQAYALLCVRGRFVVTDPAAVKALRFSCRFRGGAAVYVNGRPIARAFLPAGPITPETLADDYPPEATFGPDGHTLAFAWQMPEATRTQLAGRVRGLDSLEIPAGLLRQGVNVLAVEVHRSAHHAEQDKHLASHWSKSDWSTMGLVSAELTADDASGLVRPGVPPRQAIAWNASVLQEVTAGQFAGPAETLAPIRLAAPRNGAASGQVVLSCATAIRNLSAEATPLARAGGRGQIAPSALQVRFSRADNRFGKFDALWPTPPAEAPVADRLVATQPVWVTVKAPRDAEPGRYRGTLTLSAAGVEPIVAPIELTVSRWRLSDPKQFVTYAGVAQSPDGVALQYKLPMWSDEHFAHMAKSFELLAQLGDKSLFIPLMGQTFFGHEQGLVRWVARPDGGYDHDFSLFDRYVDLACKHLGKPTAVCLIVWDPNMGGSFRPRQFDPADDKVNPVKADRGPIVTLVDRTTGELRALEGPNYGQEGAKAFWAPVAAEARRRLAARGLDSAIVLGVSGDLLAPADAVRLWKELLPPQPAWMTAAHKRFTHLYHEPVRLTCHAVATVAPDPAVQRYYGWQAEQLDVIFQRELSLNTLLVAWRGLGEFNVASGRRGFGFVAGDLWAGVAARYKGDDKSQWKAFATYGWDQARLLSPGPDGAVANARFEMVREGIQETEARIFIERALLDETGRAKLGHELADRCQRLLDERTRYARWARGWYGPGSATQILGTSSISDRMLLVSSGWQERSARLFDAAADVADAIARP